MPVDFLIVGQGLAGSLLAFELIQRGFKIHIMDSGLENASQIAAGLINPVTGMRLVKSADIDYLLPVAKKMYQTLEVFFQQKFYHEKILLRILNNDSTYQYAQKRLQDPSYQDYLGHIIQHPLFSSSVLEQKNTGYVLIPTLLTALKKFFITHQSYQKHSFDYREINIKTSVIYQHIHAKKIIFCEGFLAHKNPWFTYLPFQLVKGEILTLQNSQPMINQILNDGQWVLPLTHYEFKTGATFDRKNINTHVSDEGRQRLLSHLHHLLPQTVEAKITQHQANIRPCTRDKHPFIGLHPLFPQLAIFNGFGAKGSLQIPYYCQQFTDFLSTAQPIDMKVNIERFANYLK